MFRILLLLGCALPLHAQTARVYRLDADGNRAHLLRTETYDQGRLAEKVSYLTDGRPHKGYTYEYDERGNVVEEIKTNLDGHEWDHIRQYEYDEQNRRIGQLHGNNLMGYWGSKRFLYDANGNLATIGHYRKSGVHYKNTQYQNRYDERGRLIERSGTDVDLDGNPLITHHTLRFAYPAENTVRETQIDSTGATVLTLTTTRDAQGRLTAETIQTPGSAAVKTTYQYDAEGRIRRREDFLGGRRTKSVDYSYRADGLPLRRWGEEVYVW